MTLDSLFDSAAVIHGLQATSKKQVFNEMALILQRQGALLGSDKSATDIVTAALARERLGSTGVGSGVALPHARLEGIKRVYGAFAALDKPMDYDAIDDRPVDLVAMLIAPTDSSNAHLRALAQISRRLRRENVRARLRKAPDASGLYMCLIDDADIALAARKSG